MKTDPPRGAAGLLTVRLFHALRLWKRYERWLDGILRLRLASRPGAFLDVGAHIGETLMKVRSVSREAPYLGFEPNPVCCYFLEELVRARGFEGCRVFAVGLSERPGLARLRSRGGATDPEASLVEGFRPEGFYASERLVPVFDGDSLLAAAAPGPVSMIKIDVEGGELEVLRGLRGTIERDRPAIVCEILPVYETGSEVGRLRARRQGEVEGLLRGLGYAFARIRPDGRIEPLERLEVHSDLSLCEHLIVQAGELEGYQAP